jgi:hypothetical protein
VQLNRIGDPAAADRVLDDLERATGLHGEHNSEGRRYVFNDEDDLGAAADRIAATLNQIAPQRWQGLLAFELCDGALAERKPAAARGVIIPR